MYKQMTMLLVGMAGLAWLSVGTAAQEKAGNADALAKEATEPFLKAMKAENIEALMKAVDLPFSWDGHPTLVDNPDELKERFAKLFAEKDLTRGEHTILEVHTFEKRLGEVSQRLGFLDQARSSWREILARDDRVVLVMTRQDGTSELIVVAVRIREGKARVAGFYG